MNKVELSTTDRAQLAEWLDKAHDLRLELDRVLGDIESIVGSIDDLDEHVGNGIDVDGLLEVVADESYRADEDEDLDEA